VRDEAVELVVEAVLPDVEAPDASLDPPGCRVVVAEVADELLDAPDLHLVDRRTEPDERVFGRHRGEVEIQSK
jgi:hypothetical protein